MWPCWNKPYRSRGNTSVRGRSRGKAAHPDSSSETSHMLVLALPFATNMLKVNQEVCLLWQTAKSLSRETLEDWVNVCDCGLSIPAPGVMTENSSRKQVCCLLERVIREREHLVYTGSFIMHNMKKSEVSEYGVKQLTFGRWGKRALAQSSLALPGCGPMSACVGAPWLSCHTGTFLPKHSPIWTDQRNKKNKESLFSVAPASSGRKN